MLNFNQLRNQITEQNSSAPPKQDKLQQENALKLRIGLTYKLEHAQNRMLVETEIGNINDLRGLENLSSQQDTDGDQGEPGLEPGIQQKIKEKATQVLEALAYEFKLFKEVTSVPDPNLWKLIAFHSRMERTFEVTNLT